MNDPIGDVVRTFFGIFSALLLGVGSCIGGTGCNPADKAVDALVPVIQSGVAKALEDTDFSALQTQAGVQLIEPELEIDFEGMICQGVRGGIKVRVGGVAAQVQTAAQADDGGS